MTNPLITEARRLFDDFPQGLSVRYLKAAKKWHVIQASDNGEDFNFIAECDDEELANGIAFAANNILAFADKIEEEEEQKLYLMGLASKHRDELERKIEEQERKIAGLKDISRVAELKRMLWECHVASGAESHTEANLEQDVEWAINAVKDLRKDYDTACEDVAAMEQQIAALQAQVEKLKHGKFDDECPDCRVVRICRWSGCEHKNGIEECCPDLTIKPCDRHKSQPIFDERHRRNAETLAQQNIKLREACEAALRHVHSGPQPVFAALREQLRAALESK